MQNALQNYQTKRNEKTNITEVWYNLLIKLKLQKDATIVELAPGFKSKIGRAVAQHNHTGKYHLIEPNDSARENVLSEYKHLLQGNINAHANCFQQIQIGKELQTRPNFLLANHALDDIVLAKATSPDDLCTFFSMNSGPERIERTRELWNQISSAKLNQYIYEAAKDLQEFIEKLRPKITILSHYESKTLTENSILRPTVVGNKVSELLYRQFQRKIDRDNTNRKDNGRNYDGRKDTRKGSSGER